MRIQIFQTALPSAADGSDPFAHVIQPIFSNKAVNSSGEGKRTSLMLPLALERTLFRFSLNTPALEVLFQLPPRIGMREMMVRPPVM